MNLRVVTRNINGFRSALQNGFWEWLEDIRADVLCVQEFRNMLAPDMCPLEWIFRGQLSPSNKGKGGVGIFTKRPYHEIHLQTPIFNDRLIVFEIYGIRIISIYGPTVSFGFKPNKNHIDERDVFWNTVISLLQEWKNHPFLLCGDLNLIASPLDIHNSLVYHRKSILPSDMHLMKRILEQDCFDVWRQEHPQDEAYSFWSFRNKKLFLENRGIRLDYHIASHHFRNQVSFAGMPMSETRFSDHCSVVVDYNIEPFYKQWKRIQ